MLIKIMYHLEEPSWMEMEQFILLYVGTNGKQNTAKYLLRGEEYG